MRVLEQRLRRNASPQQTGAAERFLFFDDGDCESQLGGADGGDVPAGTGADHDDVVFIWHVSALERRERNESGAAGFWRRLGLTRRRGLGIELGDACPKLPMIVPQFPVR